MGSSQREKTSLKSLILKYKNELSIDELDQLMALALHKNIVYIYKHSDKQLNRSTILAFKKLLNKRLAGWSLACLKGQKEFYNLTFLVNKHTLIPRPDSELLVDEALKATKNNQNIIDIGTGSGALIISVAKNNKYKASYTASDISTKALKIAQTNARKLNLPPQSGVPSAGKNKIKFKKSNLLKNIDNIKFDIVIANLPYLTPQQMAEESIKKEPITALLSGSDGLNHYKKLLKQLPNYLNKPYLVLLEIDPAQEQAIKKEIVNNLPQAKIKFLKDLSKNIRVVKITE